MNILEEKKQSTIKIESFWGGALRDDTENGCVAD